MVTLLMPVALQAGLVGLAALGLWLLASREVALALAAGGMVICLPNLLLAVRLALSPEEHFAVVLLGGKLLMWAFAGLSLWAVATVWPSVPWPALIGGLVVSSLAWLLSPMLVIRAQRTHEAKRIDALVEGLSGEQSSQRTQQD